MFGKVAFRKSIERWREIDSAVEKRHAYELVMQSPNPGRSRFKYGGPFQDSGSITCSLVTILQFGRERAGEVGRLSLPSQDDPQK